MFLMGVIFLIFLIWLWIQIYNKHAILGVVSVSFPNFVALSMVLYFVLPLFENAIKQNATIYDQNFLVDCLIAVTSMLIGSLIALLFFRKKELLNKNITQKINITENKIIGSGIKEIYVVILIGLVCILLINAYIIEVKGGWVTHFTSSYIENVGIINPNGEGLIATIPFFLVAYVLVLTNKNLIVSNKARKISIFISLLFVATFFGGGNRNIAMMIIFALIYSLYKEKKINIYVLIPIIIVGLLINTSIGIVRSYGVLNFITGNADISQEFIVKNAISLNNSELATTKLFSYYEATAVTKYPTMYGYTYTLGALINLVPMSLYPSRPLSIADHFSQFGYYGYFTGFGLGFSPIFEAKINFGSFWFIVFFIVGFLIMRISKNTEGTYTNNPCSNKYLFTGIASAVVLNFFRIDFAVTFKIIIMVFAYSWAIRLVTFRILNLNFRKKSVQT